MSSWTSSSSSFDDTGEGDMGMNRRKRGRRAPHWARVFLLTIAGGSTLSVVRPAMGHEPLFGLGPHSVGQYAWAVESEFEKGDRGWANHYEVAYGITPDIMVTTAFPYLFSTEGSQAGFGDLTLRAKYRLIRRDVLNASNAFALHGGIQLPTGNRLEGRGTGARDGFVGLSFGHEGRANYAFADVRYRINGRVDDVERGDVLNVDAAYGIRPWKLEYLQPDTVVLVEVIGQFAGNHSRAGFEDPNSGGKTLSIAPGILFSYRNVMLKGGVNIPVLEELNGLQQKPGPELVFAIEFHMPPFQ